MAISIKEALDIIDREKFAPAKETLCLEECVGRVAAKTYSATVDLPGFDNSAMDGYAIKLVDAGKEVEVVGTVLAGETPQKEVQPGKAVKIMTGAKLPLGCEAVVPIEDVTIFGDRIALPAKIKPGANMRFAGEDVKKEENILHQGDMLDAYRISLLASQGHSYIEVYKKPKVCVFATGHELKMHYEELQGTSIYNSNTPAFLARAKELGCDVHFFGKTEDSLEAIKKAIQNSLNADLIITSGGVSVGEADFTKEAFKQMGMEILFSKIDIKPGKPTTLGKVEKSFVLNLPGNPLAAQLNFEIFGRFLINKLRGYNDPYINPIEVKLGEKLEKKKGRDTVIPGFFDGIHFIPAAKRSPGMVKTMAQANGFIIFAKDATSLAQGKSVKFIPTQWNFRTKKFVELESG